MSRCPHCGSSDKGMVTPEMWSCGMEFSFRGLRTTTCYVREIEALKKKIQRLKDAAKKGKL